MTCIWKGKAQDVRKTRTNTKTCAFLITKPSETVNDLMPHSRRLPAGATE